MKFPSSKILKPFALRLAAVTVIAIISFGTHMVAQDTPMHRWTANVGGGYTPFVGDVSRSLDNGWHVTFGAGYNFNPHFSFGGQVMYNGVGVNRRVLAEAAVPDGNAHVWAFTAEPRINFSPGHAFDPYIVGGVGYYRRVVQFTQPTVTSVLIFDPFFGVFPVQVNANQVLGTFVRDGIGCSAGLGFNIGLGQTNAKIFAEGRYHYADTGPVPLRMVPVTIGIRW